MGSIQHALLTAIIIGNCAAFAWLASNSHPVLSGFCLGIILTGLVQLHGMVRRDG